MAKITSFPILGKRERKKDEKEHLSSPESLISCEFFTKVTDKASTAGKKNQREGSDAITVSTDN